MHLGDILDIIVGDIEGDLGSNSGGRNKEQLGLGRGGGQPGSEDGDRSHGRRHHASELFLFFCASTVLTVYFVFHFSFSNNRRKIEESPDPPTW